MSSARVLLGDVRERMADIPAGSIDLLVTSPPYLALRSYLPSSHPDKALEIGSEATPAAFIDVMLALTAEWRRVLAPHGSICVELGDTYSGGERESAGVDAPQDGGYHISERIKAPGHGHNSKTGIRNMDDKIQPGGRGWPLAKSRALVPELYRIGLAYAINPLTGQPSPAGRWRVRQVHYHCRPNPPVGALGDKFRPSVSEWVIACTSPKRWFDLDAVRTEPVSDHKDGESIANYKSGIAGTNGFGRDVQTRILHPAGAPPLDHSWIEWDDWFPAAQRTPTTPYKGQHYASFGGAVIRPFIEAMCPQQVCTVCGEPRRRIVDRVPVKASRADQVTRKRQPDGSVIDWGDGTIGQAVTVGWSDCGHASWRNGVVLDPFVGSGTTLEVATGCGRDAIGVDLDSRNLDLIRKRVGLFLADVSGPEDVPDVSSHNSTGNPRFRVGYLRNDGRTSTDQKNYGESA